MFNKKETEEFFQKLEQRHGQPEEMTEGELNENIGASLTVEAIRDLSDEFNL